MKEIEDTIKKYYDKNIEDEISSFDKLVTFSSEFYFDVAEICDSITRIKNIERNPSGFNFNDAAILGLLIRIWKILKEVVYYYKKNNGDIIALLDRQIVEAVITAKYLLLSDEETIKDYRKCSYKNRLEIASIDPDSNLFFKTPAGKRLKKSVLEKMSAEKLTINSFKQQKKNKWKLSGKNFFEIFSSVEPEKFYKYMYGITSESIHGSWNDSMDYHLIRNSDDTFLPYPHFQQVDIRLVTPIIRLLNDPYLLWLKRIDAESDYINKAFKFINTINIKLFNSFEGVYAEKIKESI
ncbi:hypothetical protein KAR28_01985 [Candidatus Parcubacteria bacterium]|nr:hypothetical protein [Candidatus Parcubacteria bacterium]